MFATANLNSSDIVHPWLQILQSNSKVVETNQAEKGKIYNTLTKETFSDIDLIFLGARKEFKVFHSSRLKYRSSDMKTLLENNDGKWVDAGFLEQSPIWKNRMKNASAQTFFVFHAVIANNTKQAIYVRLSIGGIGYAKAKEFINAATLQKDQYFVTKLAIENIATEHGIKYIPRFKITNDPVPEFLLKELQTQKIKQDIQNFCSPQQQALISTPQKLQETEVYQKEEAAIQ